MAAVHWYRNFERNGTHEPLAGKQINQPACSSLAMLSRWASLRLYHQKMPTVVPEWTACEIADAAIGSNDEKPGSVHPALLIDLPWPSNFQQ